MATVSYIVHIWVVVLGGERARGIAVDTYGAAYLTGETGSTNFSTVKEDQGSYDASVTKLSNGGNSLVYSTYLGDDGDESGMGIAVDASGAAYVTGYTHSDDFPTTPDSFFPYWLGDNEAFVAKLVGGEGCCMGNTGNIDGDAMDEVNIADLVYMVAWMTGTPAGPEPPCLEEADVDGSGEINIADLVYLADYQFNFGPAPVSCP